MNLRTRLKLVAALSLCVATAASAQYNGAPLGASDQFNKPPVLTTDQKLLYPERQEFHLSSGDTVTVHLFGVAEFAPAVRIGDDGQVLLPLIGLVKLQGLTITQAEEYLAQRFTDAGMYVDPQVTLQVTEGPNSFLTIVGEVHGLVPVFGSRRLFDAIASSGGLPPTASHVVTINRPGLSQPIVVDLGTDAAQSSMANIPVFPGDTIVVGRVGVIYLVGAFKSPGALPLAQNTPLTLLQATALSGGVLFEGKYDDLHLIRTIGNQRTVVKLDIQKVLHGTAPDPILQPNDILFLPTSTMKSAISSGGISVLLSLVSVGLAAIAINR